MAVTEFKTAKTNCSQLPEIVRGRIPEPNLQGAHAPISQVMVYAAGDVLSSLRRNGLDDDKITLLVLACDLVKRVPSPSPYACVRGELQVPSVIGKRFEYGIKEGVEFGATDWAEKTATAYVMVMKEGLERAIKITSAAALPKPASLCGSKLRRNGDLLDCELAGTPVPQPPNKIVSQALPFCMGQGELFTCDLPREESGASDSDPGHDSVLIKVTCISVHAYLHFPSTSNAALKAVKAIGSGILDDVLIEHVLYRGQATLVLILKDLGAQGYCDFCPQQLSATVGKSGLWKAVGDLTERVLIPMTEAKVVHADI